MKCKVRKERVRRKAATYRACLADSAGGVSTGAFIWVILMCGTDSVSNIPTELVQFQELVGTKWVALMPIPQTHKLHLNNNLVELQQHIAGEGNEQRESVYTHVCSQLCQAKRSQRTSRFKPKTLNFPTKVDLVMLVPKDT